MRLKRWWSCIMWRRMSGINCFIEGCFQSLGFILQIWKMEKIPVFLWWRWAGRGRSLTWMSRIIIMSWRRIQCRGRHYFAHGLLRILGKCGMTCCVMPIRNAGKLFWQYYVNNFTTFLITILNSRMHCGSTWIRRKTFIWMHVRRMCCLKIPGNIFWICTIGLCGWFRRLCMWMDLGQMRFLLMSLNREDCFENILLCRFFARKPVMFMKMNV